jgi:hypothetical protein
MNVQESRCDPDENGFDCVMMMMMVYVTLYGRYRPTCEELWWLGEFDDSVGGMESNEWESSWASTEALDSCHDGNQLV